MTEEEQQYWLTTIVYIINKYRILQEAEENDLTYDQIINDDEEDLDDDDYDDDYDYDDYDDDNYNDDSEYD